MRENENERELLKASLPKVLLIIKKFFTKSYLGAFIAKPSYKLPKYKKQTLLQGENLGRTKFGVKKSTKSSLKFVTLAKLPWCNLHFA